MVYRKNQRKKSLMVCIVFIMLFILGVTAGTISYAYFSDSAKAENTLNFGKLRIATVKNGASEYVNVKLSGADKLAVNDNVTLNGSVGLEEGSVDAYIRMRMVVKDNELSAEISSTFNDAFLKAMESITSKDKSNVDMKWFVVGDYLYLGNKIEAGKPFVYSDANTNTNKNVITLTDEMIPKQFQGLDIQITFIFEAIQSAGMKDKDDSVIETLSGYTEDNAEKISGISAWNKLFEPELNTIYKSKYATNYIRGDLDETAYKTGAQVVNQMTKSPYNYFTRSKDNNKGNYVAFGFFPQTIKADDVVVKDSWKETFNGVEYYLGSDGYLYEKEKVNANSGDYKYGNGKLINAEEYSCFKLEPIIWQILTESDGNAYLLSVSGLTAGKFGSNSIYAGSEIGTYLNDNFYKKAFGESNSLVQETTLKVGSSNNISALNDSTGYNLGTETTKYKVFLPSATDLINSSYGFKTDMSGDTMRIKYLTDYAGARGSLSGSNYSVVNGGYWWLRSAHSNNMAWFVGFTGDIISFDVNTANSSIVPSLLLKIK